MLDLDKISISEECTMMCTEVQYEDVVVYRDQGISTEEYEKATYGKLIKKPKAKKRKKLSEMWPYVQMAVCHWKRKKAT